MLLVTVPTQAVRSPYLPVNPSAPSPFAAVSSRRGRVHIVSCSCSSSCSSSSLAFTDTFRHPHEKSKSKYGRNRLTVKFEKQQQYYYFGRGSNVNARCARAANVRVRVKVNDDSGDAGRVECHESFTEEDSLMEEGVQQPNDDDDRGSVAAASRLPYSKPASVSAAAATSTPTPATATATVEMSSRDGMKGKSFWSKVTQNLNFSGVFSSATVIVKDRHLAIPHVSVPDITWIDWKALHTRGFKGVVFDKDNTLTAPYAQNVWPALTKSLEECRQIFGDRIALLSNSAGLYQYDPLGEEASAVEEKLGIPVIRHGQKKPGGNALDVSSHFSSDPSLLIMVGDRYFTDIIYGNRNGFLTIRPAPLTTIGEPFTVKRIRLLEDTLVDRWRRQGSLAPKHKFCDNPVEFIKDPGCW